MGRRTSPKEDQEISEAYKKERSITAVALLFHKNPKTIRASLDRTEALNNSRTPDSNVQCEGNRFSQYVKLRYSQNTCSQCLIKMKLSPEELEKFEKSYLHIKNLDQFFSVAMKLNDAGIDCELLIREVEEKGSIGNYLKTLAEIQTRRDHEQDLLEKYQLQRQTSLRDIQDLVKTKLNLERSIKSLTAEEQNMKLDIQNKTRILDQLLLQHNKSFANFKLQCEELKSKTTDGAIKAIEEFQKNDNLKLEALLISLIGALRANPAALFEICFIGGPLLPSEVPSLIQRFSREVALSRYFTETVLHLRFIDPTGYETVPQAAFVYPNNLQQTAEPTGSDLDQILRYLSAKPPIPYQLSALDTYARQQVHMNGCHQEQIPASLPQGDNIREDWVSNYSYPDTPSADVTCNGQACVMNKTKPQS